jgi:hypothetical protein
MLTRRQRLAKSWKRLRGRIRVSKSGQPSVGFIFGVQRSGTNMFIESFGACPNVEAFYENDEEAFDNYRLRDIPTIKKLVNRSFANVVVFKPIADSQHALEILDSVENSKAIWVFRHYTDVINSALRNWVDHRGFLGYVLNDKKKANWRVEKLSDETLELIQRLYDEGIDDASSRGLIWCIRNEFFFSQGLDGDSRVRLANYEQLVSAPDTSLKVAYEFFGADYDSSFSSAIHQSSLKKNNVPALLPEIQAMCDQMWERLVHAYEKQEAALSGNLSSVSGS